MKIVLVNAVDGGGGAAIACTRLAEALNQEVHEVKVLVQKSKGEGHPLSMAVLKSKLQKLPYFFRGKKHQRLLSNYPHQQSLFSYPLGNGKIHTHPLLQQADVIHLHWVNDKFLSLNDIKAIADMGKPVFVTMHDMWYFTGGCHYTGSCDKFTSHCGACPVLGSNTEYDLAYQVFEGKLKTLAKTNITYITPSRWLADVAKTSRLLADKKVVTIPNTINTHTYKPIDKFEALKTWGIEPKEGVKYILFGAVGAVEDERKGFKYLIEALNKMPSTEGVELLVFGSKDINIDVPFKVHNLGWINNQEQMINAYNAADVFITPSLEDNLPNTIMEAMACGTPCVGFNTGGIPEMIVHEVTGYVAIQKDTDDMAKGISYVLANYSKLQDACINKVETAYSNNIIAEQHIALYGA